MALSEGLKGFVDFFTKSFDSRSDEDAFEFGSDMEDFGGEIDGNVALDAMYGTRVKPEKSFSRESKVSNRVKRTS